MNAQSVGCKVKAFGVCNKLAFLFQVIVLLLPACTRHPQPEGIEEITFQSGEFNPVSDLRTPAGTLRPYRCQKKGKELVYNQAGDKRILILGITPSQLCIIRIYSIPLGAQEHIVYMIHMFQTIRLAQGAVKIKKKQNERSIWRKPIM